MTQLVQRFVDDAFRAESSLPLQSPEMLRRGQGLPAGTIPVRANSLVIDGHQVLLDTDPESEVVNETRRGQWSVDFFDDSDSGNDKAAAVAAWNPTGTKIIFIGDGVSDLPIATSNGGADVIFDGNAGDRAPMNLDAVAPMGHIVYLGASGGQAPPVPPSMLIGKSCSMSGFVQYFHQAISDGAEIAETHKALAAGTWRIPIEREFDLTEVAEAHRAWEARELLGRSVIRVGGDL